PRHHLALHSFPTRRSSDLRDLGHGLDVPALPLFRKAHERDRPRPLDGDRQLSLMPQAIARHPARNDPTPFGQEVAQQPDVLIIKDRKSTRLNSSHVSISYA